MWLYWIGLSLYSVFSYSLTDPNLVLTSWPPYWQWQNWLWRTFFDHPLVVAQAYAGIVVLIQGSFLGWWLRQRHRTLTWSGVLKAALILSLPLLVAYNALSHDVFNYIFNAKMVTVYQADPHRQVALNFAEDDWVRFMHNTHTPAPYGYGWTAWSLIPSVMGLGKFTLTWELFRAWSWLSWLLLGLAYLKTAPNSQKSRWLGLFVLVSPVVLIEIIGNAHNDLWMMVPAVLSLALVAQSRSSESPTRLTWRTGLVSAGLLLFATSLKFATLVLWPLWLLLILGHPWTVPTSLRRWFKLLHQAWPVLASLAMFCLLLLPRSQQFHPWYLTWVIVWLPYIQWSHLNQRIRFLTQVWVISLVVLSTTILFRYLPWLVTGGFGDEVLVQQKLITWLPWLLGSCIAAGWLHHKSQEIQS